MIVDAFILASVTGAGFYLIWTQLPIRIKAWLMNHKLFTRICCAIGTYTLLGGTLTALFAAGFLDLMVGTILNILNDPEANKNLQRVGAYLKDLKNKVTQWITEACKAIPTPQATTP